MANPNTITWINYQDIQIPEATLRKQFDKLMADGNYASALALLRNNQVALEGRSFVAENVMKIVDGVRFLQGQFNDNVPVFMSELATQYFNLVDELGDVGEWVDYLQYEPYNFVKYNGDVYLSISQSNAGETPAENEYWVKLGLKGDDGVPGVDANMRYGWNVNQEYTTLDLVVYGEDIYVAVKNNKGVTPGTDDSIWTIFVAVTKGRINVGINPPDNPEQNTIWFKTTVDPLTDTSGAIGQMYRYKIDGTWEEMYPTTFFSLIEGVNRYASTAFIDSFTIPSSQWSVLDGKYITAYRSNRIKENSRVDVFCDAQATLEQYHEYSYLGMTVDVDILKFTMPYRPTFPMTLNIIIQ